MKNVTPLASPPEPPAEPERTIRERIMDAAVLSLIEHGTARTTTLQVQQRAGVSRGALLHHFPTHAQLLSATVEHLVRRNEQEVSRLLEEELRGEPEPVERAIRVLARMMAQPAYLAELELWAVARSDEGLRTALTAAERSSRQASERILRMLFAAVAGRPGHDAVIALSAEFLRGHVLTGVLRRPTETGEALLSHWVRATRILLEHWR